MGTLSVSEGVKIKESAKITHTKIKHMPPERKPQKFPNIRYLLSCSQMKK